MIVTSMIANAMIECRGGPRTSAGARAYIENPKAPVVTF